MKLLNFKIIWSTVTACILGAVLIVLSFYLGNSSKEVAINIAVMVLGISLGWLIGIIISPYSVNEKKMFSEYTKAIGVFASGYLVGKIDRFIEALLRPDFILDSTIGFRFIAFISSLVIAIMITFVYRHYA
jgi:hypothetical protein